MNITTMGRLYDLSDDGQTEIADLESCLSDCDSDFLPTRREAQISLADMRQYRTTWVDAENDLRIAIDTKLCEVFG